MGDGESARRLSQQRYSQLYSLQLAMDKDGSFAKLPENVDDVFQQRLPVTPTKPTLPQSYQQVPTSPTSTQPMVETTPVAIEPAIRKQPVANVPKNTTSRQLYPAGHPHIGLNLMENVQGARVAHMAQVVSTSYSIPERYTENVSIGSA